MPKFIDLTGKRFGRLTVVKRVESDKHGNSKFKCLCDCGKERVVYRNALATGKTVSCGCYNSQVTKARSTIHGYTSGGKKTPEYIAITNIIARCTNPKNPEYERYGGRGIKVCERWRENPCLFVEDMGLKPSKRHSIERVDVNGDYEPSNCIWATPLEQSRNQRAMKNGTGVRGVSKHSNGRYRVGIHVNRKRIHVGYFETMTEAIKAREKAEQKYWTMGGRVG